MSKSSTRQATVVEFRSAIQELTGVNYSCRSASTRFAGRSLVFGGLNKFGVVEAVEGVVNAKRSPSGCGKRSDRSGFQGPVGEPSEAMALP